MIFLVCSFVKLPVAGLGEWCRTKPAPNCQCDSLQATHEEQDEQYDQQQPETAAWVIAPTLTVRPGGQRPDEEDCEYYDEKNL